MKKGSIVGTLAISSITVLLLWLAMAGTDRSWSLLAVACVVFIVYVCRVSRKHAVICALLTGVGHFLLQLYWIIFVLGQYGGLPLFLSIPALLLLCLYMAMYFLVFVLLARFFVERFSPHVSLWLLPSTWVALDYLRSFLFSGFPWMDLGYGVAAIPFVFQSVDLWGHYGLTFIVVLINSFFALVILQHLDLRRAVRMAFPVFLLCVATVLYSNWSWHQTETSMEQSKTINVAVVQGNVDQGQKWNPAKREITVRNYVDQSLQQMRTKDLLPDLIVWPETSLPFFPVNNPLLKPVITLVTEEKVMLLTGSPWYERDEKEPAKLSFFNSSLLFDSKGDIIARTSKSHLVPFGEYVPFKEYLTFIAPLVEAVGNFSRGEIRNPPACKTARIGVLICFESIFGDISRKWVDAGANLLVNMTNDAWYGKTSAPYQTLAMTKLRAVETRRSIVRSANTGFSGFIDPLGRLQNVSPLFLPWNATEQVTLMEERTLFVRGGYLFGPACLALICLGVIFAPKRRKYTNTLHY